MDGRANDGPTSATVAYRWWASNKIHCLIGLFFNDRVPLQIYFSSPINFTSSFYICLYVSLDVNFYFYCSFFLHTEFLFLFSFFNKYRPTLS